MAAAADPRVTMTVRLPPDLVKRIDIMAARETRTRTAQVEHVLKDYVQREFVEKKGR